jgi:hypothetical protein
MPHFLHAARWLFSTPELRSAIANCIAVLRASILSTWWWEKKTLIDGDAKWLGGRKVRVAGKHLTQLTYYLLQSDFIEGPLNIRMRNEKGYDIHNKFLALTDYLLQT